MDVEELLDFFVEEEACLLQVEEHGFVGISAHEFAVCQSSSSLIEEEERCG